MQLLKILEAWFMPLRRHEDDSAATLCAKEETQYGEAAAP